jgi:hypothetical protein
MKCRSSINARMQVKYCYPQLRYDFLPEHSLSLIPVLGNCEKIKFQLDQVVHTERAIY